VCVCVCVCMCVCVKERRSLAKNEDQKQNNSFPFHICCLFASVLLQKKLLNNIMTGLVKSCHLFPFRKSVGRKKEREKMENKVWTVMPLIHVMLITLN